MTRKSYLLIICILIGSLLISACEAAAMPIVPTDPPTETATFTPSPTSTSGPNISPTPPPSPIPQSGAASPTSLFGSTRTALPPDFPTPTRPFNPSAPRIEFFTSDPLSVEPGRQLSLFWSARNIDAAVIYRLNDEDERTEVFNVPPDGNLTLDTSRNDRGVLRFALGVGEGADYEELQIVIPLECPVDWFFSPAPGDCAISGALESTIIDQTMERGRLLFIEETNVVYVLFNDGQQPGWSSFENLYDPDIHRDRDPNAPPEFIQPLAELGYIWRTNETVRTRLGLGFEEAAIFSGFIQSSPGSRGREIVYISGSNGVVLQVLPGNQTWQIIGAPR